jgi:hypothetical protein
MSIVQTGEVHEPGAVMYRPLEIGGCPQGESGLTNSAGSHQRKQTGISERRLELRQKSASTHEAGRLCW